MTKPRPYNFSAGPAAIPLEVLDQAAAEMTDWHGSGMGVMEMSHRGKEFISIYEQAEDEIMLITDTGVLVRTRVAEIREMGRATQGVILIGLDEGAKLSGLQRIVENDAENGVDNEGETGDASEGEDTNNGTPTDGVA